jgi:hypothetical protein
MSILSAYLKQTQVVWVSLGRVAVQFQELFELTASREKHRCVLENFVIIGATLDNCLCQCYSLKSIAIPFESESFQDYEEEVFWIFREGLIAQFERSLQVTSVICFKLSNND